MLRQNPQKREGVHNIELIMNDGTQIHVTPRVLDELIEARRVAKFKRASGWVTVGTDPIRNVDTKSNLTSYAGPERRLVY